MKRFNVTINTDASFCPFTRAAGFACWIVCNAGRIKYSGILKNADTAMKAEQQAIVNAVHILKNSSFNNGFIDKIYINTDCKAAILRVGLKSSDKIGKITAKKFKSIIKNNPNDLVVAPRYQFKHVKAHTDNSDARSWVNNWCDVEAKTQMNIERRNRNK